MEGTVLIFAVCTYLVVNSPASSSGEATAASSTSDTSSQAQRSAGQQPTGALQGISEGNSAAVCSNDGAAEACAQPAAGSMGPPGIKPQVQACDI